MSDSLAHVKTTDVDDGGCLVCDECDLRPGHADICDCECRGPNASLGYTEVEK